MNAHCLIIRCSRVSKYSRVRNKRTPMIINYLTFFQELLTYSGLNRAYLSSISVRYKWGYAYSFLTNFPGAMFIQGATFIPDSRVKLKY